MLIPAIGSIQRPVNASELRSDAGMSQTRFDIVYFRSNQRHPGSVAGRHPISMSEIFLLLKDQSIMYFAVKPDQCHPG